MAQERICIYASLLGFLFSKLVKQIKKLMVSTMVSKADEICQSYHYHRLEFGIFTIILIQN